LEQKTDKKEVRDPSGIGRYLPDYWWIVVFPVMAVAPFFLGEYGTILAREMLIMGLFALSLNIILGNGGMVHFGHGAFFGIGSYTLAILLKNYSVNPYLSFVIAPVVTAFIALIVGWFCVRLTALYFSILTIAFGQLFYIIVFEWYGFTGGDDGIHGIPKPPLIDSHFEFYYFTLIVCFISFILIKIILNSSFGVTLVSTRENMERVSFLGVNVRRHQLITFVIGSFFAGLAGALIAWHNQFVFPLLLHWTKSAEPILASLMGGMFYFFGPVIGASLLVYLHHFFTSNIPWPYSQFWPIVLGGLLVIMVLGAPEGISGLAHRLTGKKRRD
jgi:branched-chain amino acid transport system permease protein